jgi:hypothetical protein
MVSYDGTESPIEFIEPINEDDERRVLKYTK